VRNAPAAARSAGLRLVFDTAALRKNQIRTLPGTRAGLKFPLTKENGETIVVGIALGKSCLTSYRERAEQQPAGSSLSLRF
jgi:hypothetical protein